MESNKRKDMALLRAIKDVAVALSNFTQRFTSVEGETNSEESYYVNLVDGRSLGAFVAVFIAEVFEFL